MKNKKKLFDKIKETKKECVECRLRGNEDRENWMYDLWKGMEVHDVV